METAPYASFIFFAVARSGNSYLLCFQVVNLGDKDRLSNLSGLQWSPVIHSFSEMEESDSYPFGRG